MADGQAKEFNHPYCLMVNAVGDECITRQHGYFSKMVLETDAETALSLFEMAKQSYDKSVQKWPTVPEPAEVAKTDDVFFEEESHK